MKEMNHHSNQGTHTMKKTFLVVALATMLVFGFAASAMADANGGSGAVVSGGYILWSTASNNTQDVTAQDFGPHGNYTTNSLKCAVCHSVHGSVSGGIALTKVPNTLTAPTQICAYCHGIGTSVTSKIVSVGYLTGSDHTGGCAGACHATSVHGADASIIPALGSRLLNNRADVPVIWAYGVNSAITGLTPLMMDDVNGPLAKTMATAYTCAGDGASAMLGGNCHTNSAFGIAKSGQAMDLDGFGAGTWKTGHPVYQTAHSNWSETGAMYTGTVAYADATGCNKCHDVIDSTLSKPSFPHNQVDAAGHSYDVPHTAPSSKLWMTKAAYTGATKTTITDPLYQTNYAGIVDGVCLKCHRGTATSGVGYDF